MLVNIVQDYKRVMTIATRDGSDGIYTVRFQDNSPPSICKDRLLETYANAGAVRELISNDYGFTTARSLQINSYAVGCSPVYYDNCIMYLSICDKDSSILLHDENGPRAQLYFKDIKDTDGNSLRLLKYKGMSDKNLAVYSSEQVGFIVTSDSSGGTKKSNLDVLKDVCLVYPDLTTSLLRFRLGELNFHDILPMNGQFVKFDRSKHVTDIRGKCTVNFTYIVGSVNYTGLSIAVRNKILLADGRKYSVPITFPREVVGFCGMEIIEGRHLMLYKLKPLDPPNSSYYLLEISNTLDGEFKLTDFCEFHIKQY